MEEIRKELTAKNKKKLLRNRIIILIALIIIIFWISTSFIISGISLFIGIIAIIWLSTHTPFVHPDEMHKEIQERENLPQE